MKSDLLSLSRLFTESLFRIPDYQRGYSWVTKHLKDFWTDIEQLEVGKNHYTGVLTLEDVPPRVYQRWTDDLWIIESKRYHPYYVVDGQQRLTTALVLVQAILEHTGASATLNYSSKDDIRRRFISESKDGGVSQSFLFGYEKDNPSYEFLKTQVLMARSDHHSSNESTIYTRNLNEAKQYFYEKVSALSHEQLERLYRKLTQHVLFNVYVIADDVDVCVAFETMNNRGKPLSHLELLKNRLIFLSTKLPDVQSERDALRAAVNESWKTVYHYLGRKEDAPLDDDLFLSSHYALHFGATQLASSQSDAESDDEPADPFDPDNYSEFLLGEHFTVKNVVATAGRPPAIGLKTLYEYSHSVKDFVQIYEQVLNPLTSSFSQAEIVVLDQLSRLLDDDDPEYLLVLALFRTRVRERVEILRLIERCTFLRRIVYVSDLRRLQFAVLALEFAAGRKSAADLLRDLTKHVSDYLVKADIPKRLALWATKPLGYYQWRELKYFMFEYEQTLRSAAKDGRAKLHWREFVGEGRSHDNATIEHIYPQKVTDAYWKTRFAAYTQRQRNLLKNSLGNLLPLSQSKNSSLSNKSFDEKKGGPDGQRGYAYGCYTENEVALSKEWTATQILERGVRLLSFLEERWEVQIGSREKKIAVLELEFVAKK